MTRTSDPLARFAASLLLALVVGAFSFWPCSAQAKESGTATFALILGVNRSVDKGLAPLRYADDDGVRYFELFRALGARSYLLARVDSNTRRLHAQAAAESHYPTSAGMAKAVRALVADVRQARRRGLKTAFYFIYAGHGNVENSRGYITLEDARLTGEAIQQQILSKVAADQSHLIIDACYSFFVAHSRGAGGRRRRISDFSRLRGVFDVGQVGLLLSTSSARESHEWEAFQAGVFSHEVRSGLYGAADANGDSRVSYRELAAFVEHANRAIPNERYRPSIFARAPTGGDTLLDLRGAKRRLRVDPERHGHHYLENADGVRLADFHNSPKHPVELLRPLSDGTIFVRSVSDDREYQIPLAPDVVRLASLDSQVPRTRTRGAAHVAFSRLFQLPFGPDVVARYKPAPLIDDGIVDHGPMRKDDQTWRPYVGWSLIGVGTVASGVASYLLLDAQSQRESSEGLSQRDIAARNDLIQTRRVQAGVVYGIGIAAFAGGLVTLVTGESQPPIAVTATHQGGSASYTTSF